ncbi:glycosyltransferase [Planctomycetota bacterium]
MKVLHLPTLVGGNAWGLAQGERKLGLDSRVLTRKNVWLDYPCDMNLQWDKKNVLGMFISAVDTFLKVRRDYDVFHFNFGTSLLDMTQIGLPLLDLPFYPHNKRIIFSYNGCDARQKYETIERVNFSACHNENCYGGICTNKKQDRIKARKIKKAGKYANHLFALNPDLMWFLPQGATFLPYTIAEWDNIHPVPCRLEKKIKVIHSPTDRAAKGSDCILKALENLQKRYDIEIILVENTPNKKAIKLYERADIVIDQALVGWYGGLAVEAMKMGKPVAVFIRKDDLQFVPISMAKDLCEAVIEIEPSTIEESIELYLQNPTLLKQKSQAALEYVHQWHDPVYVASMTKSVYET